MGRGTSRLIQGFQRGGQMAIQAGHRDSSEASSPGCRQGGQCPRLGGLPLLAEPGQGKVRRAQEENFRPPDLRLCNSSRGSGYAPQSRPLLRPGDAGAALPRPGRRRLGRWMAVPAGGGRPGNCAVPMATRRPSTRGWGRRNATPAFSPALGGLRGFPPWASGAA